MQINFLEKLESELKYNAGTICQQSLNHSFYMGHGGGENKAGIGIFVESTRGTTILGNALWSCFVDRGTGNDPGHRLVWAYRRM